MTIPACAVCGAPVDTSARFCRACGAPAAPPPPLQEAAPPASPRRGMSRRTKAVYLSLVIAVFGIVAFTFLRHLPGGAHPVIGEQPEIAMATLYTDQTITPVPIAAETGDGAVSFPLSILLEKKIVQFEYRTPTGVLPLLAYISPGGKLVTAVRICEPCNSHTFRLEGTELACGNCETRWKLDNLEGIQGSCQKYPPDPVPSSIVGSRVRIDEKILQRWKMRI